MARSRKIYQEIRTLCAVPYVSSLQTSTWRRVPGWLEWGLGGGQNPCFANGLAQNHGLENSLTRSTRRRCQTLSRPALRILGVDADGEAGPYATVCESFYPGESDEI